MYSLVKLPWVSVSARVAGANILVRGFVNAERFFRPPPLVLAARGNVDILKAPSLLPCGLTLIFALNPEMVQ